MPKKGKEKSPEVRRKAQASETGPGVSLWQTDQGDDVDAPDLPPPSADEQERMAQFWAMEESQGPKSWEDEQELDYSEIARRRAPSDHLSSSANSGNPDLFRYAQSSVFNVRYLGHIRDPIQESESQIKTLVAIDTAQKQGLLPWLTSEDSTRSLSLSKYGIKVTDVRKQRVFARHPLHWIANITYYEDTYGKHMLVLRQSKQERTADYQDLFIYEATDEAQAKDICLTLAQAFEAVHNKMKLVENLHSPDRSK